MKEKFHWFPCPFKNETYRPGRLIPLRLGPDFNQAAPADKGAFKQMCEAKLSRIPVTDGSFDKVFI